MKQRISNGEYGIKILRDFTFSVLYIPKNSIIFESNEVWENKCRTNLAYVVDTFAINCLGICKASIGALSIYEDDDLISYPDDKANAYCKIMVSKRIVYAPGRYVKPIHEFDDKPLVCSSGIHFFKTWKDLANSQMFAEEVKKHFSYNIMDYENVYSTVEHLVNEIVEGHMKTMEEDK